MLQASLPVVAGITLLIGLLFLDQLRRKHRRFPLPPGPRGLPIIGNVLEIPAERPWITYSQWSKQLASDVIHVSAFGKSIIVLNSAKAISDLLDHRWALYSDRPRMVMAGEL
jgi:hypothetical protein